MKDLNFNYYDIIDKERNVYELASLHSQNRRPVSEYMGVLQDPITGQELKLENEELFGEKKYPTKDDIADFTNTDRTSEAWKKLNQQFLNYHRSLSIYTILNETPFIHYVGFKSGISNINNVKVLDVGAGTGHTYCSFFHEPETIDYYLLDPNLRLLHDQFYRIYPKLSYLKIAHILANAEYLPIKDNSFDVVLNLSAVDHFDDYKKFISESFRVLKPGGKFLISSHLDIKESDDDATSFKDKLFSDTFFERLSRYKYYKKHAVGDDDHTLHLKNEKPIENAILETGFKISKKELFKRHFFFLAEK